MDTTNPGARDPGVSGALDRRRFLLRLGWGGITAMLGTAVPGLLRFLAPQERGVADAAIDMGPVADYRAGLVSTRWVHRHGLWLVHRDGRIFALQARCTHLGCTPRWVPEMTLFRCPCHGSRFAPDGTPVNGPATQPLARLAIQLERGRIIVNRSRVATMEAAERDARFFVEL